MAAIEAQEPQTALVTVEEINVPAVFGDGNTESVLMYIRGQVSDLLDVTHDIEDPKVRKELKSAAYKVTRSKTILDEAGKEYAAELKARVQAIDGNRRTIRDELDKLRDEIRQPVEQWEAEQERRAAEIEANIRTFIEAGQFTNGTPGQIQEVLDTTKGIELTDELFGDRQGEAAIQKDIAVSNLERALKAAEKREAEAAELEALRQREAERAEEDRVRAIQEAAQREAAESERLAREKAEADAQAAREAEERAKEEARLANERAEKAAAEAAEAERQRQERDRRKKQEEEERRAADLEHRKKVSGEAAHALVEWAALSEEDANTVVTVIAAGMIPHVQLRY